MTEVAETAARSGASQSMGRGSALLIALLVTFVLGALAFWPKRAWSPPPRPALHAPIVFDEFVNPPTPASANSSAPDPAAH
jgi:hypothetical protein